MNINRINDISSKYINKKTDLNNNTDSNFDKMFLEETSKEGYLNNNDALRSSNFNSVVSYSNNQNNIDTYRSEDVYVSRTNVPINTTYSIKSSSSKNNNITSPNLDYHHIVNELSKNIAMNVHSHITESRVSELKSSIQNKSYFINSEDLADKILGKV